MKVRWQFLIECKGFQFDRIYEFEGELTREQAKAFDLPCPKCAFLITIEPKPKTESSSRNQFCRMKILLPGNVEQTKDLACWIAVNASENISFFHGELKAHGGLLVGERIPETPEEEQLLGNDRWFAEAHIVEVRPTPTFDGSSFRKIAPEPISAAIRHFNAAMKANNPIDQFLGLFRILEDFYSSTHRHLAEALKMSPELLQVACQHITYTENGKLDILQRVTITNLLKSL